MASYDVEEVLDSRKKGKNTEYLVRWAPTWEAEKNLNCAKLIKEFKAKTGSDDTEENGDANEDEDAEEDSEANTSSRKARKAATAGNRKRKATQKAQTPKKAKSKRRR